MVRQSRKPREAVPDEIAQADLLTNTERHKRPYILSLQIVRGSLANSNPQRRFVGMP